MKIYCELIIPTTQKVTESTDDSKTEFLQIHTDKAEDPISIPRKEFEIVYSKSRQAYNSTISLPAEATIKTATSLEVNDSNTRQSNEVISFFIEKLGIDTSEFSDEEVVEIKSSWGTFSRIAMGKIIKQ